MNTGLSAGVKKEALEFFMFIYDPQDHGTLCRNVHEPGIRTRTMKIIQPWHDGFPPQGHFRGTAGQCDVYHYAHRH